MNSGDFPTGSVVKNPPSNAGDMSSILGGGTYHRATKSKSCNEDSVQPKKEFK